MDKDSTKCGGKVKEWADVVAQIMMIYDNWMARKEEYLNEQVDLTAVEKLDTAVQETDCRGKRLTAVESEG